ncbi:hypothetical protein CVT24_000537 [Panaeolus cyanescens]|uniref:SP-RING-type domain-containing protein n=1 Tax=Panaeolus cyanescens TaxID=181874 RepID=A0A409V8G7_9AGAR|nr:hypothetical protein CVT24_000537 [Panaeolus cyanescens]
MASSDPWSDFETVRHNVKQNTVDKLKQIMTGFNEECASHLSKTGKKQELIDRIITVLETWRAANCEDKWVKAKAIVEKVRSNGAYTSTFNRNSSFSSGHSGYEPAKPFYPGTASASTSSVIYDPFAPPRKTTGTVPMASTSSASKLPTIRFKESCFWTLEQSVSALVECPETLHHQDRKQQHLSFTLTPDQLAKMKTPGKRFQLRLFCTSSAFYTSPHAYRSNPIACPMEFPPTCEVRVNNVQISANLKGLKKKPGTAPPPDITSYCRLGSPNRLEMVYVNSQQPVVAKYYMMVMLVEGKTVDNLVENLKTSKYQSAHTTRQHMQKALDEDDDIVAGPQKMSLRCPLTYARLNTPSRSSKCVHAQCFDATSWFSMMEQTTTWLCPVCERVLDYNDLIVDGYIDEILKDVPEAVEEVMVEADGEWHTVDNKYGSPNWRAKHPPPSAAPKPIARAPSILQNANQQNGKGKAPDVEVFVLSDDDDTEEEGRVKRELSPSYASSTNQSFDGSISRGSQSQPPPHTPQTNVIDLTLDSDDEEEAPRRTAPPPPPPPSAPATGSTTNGKRKVGDAELDKTTAADQIWKKGRLDPSRFLPPLPPPRPSGMNAAGPALPLSLSHTPTSPRGRFASAFHNNTLPPIQNGIGGLGARTASNGNLSLPPLPVPSNGTYGSPRSTSQNSRWPG